MDADQMLSMKLVKAIEKRPCLYNSKIPHYSRKDITDKSWIEISKELNKDVSTLRERWKNLRTVFVRKLKLGNSGCSVKLNKPYYLNEAMQFILPFVRPTPGSSNDGQESLTSPSSDIQLNESESESNDLHFQINDVQIEEKEINIREIDIKETDALQLDQQNQLNSSQGGKSIEDEQSNHQKPLTHSVSLNIGQTKRKRTVDLCENEKIIDNHCCCNSKCRKHDEDARKMFVLSLLPELHQMTEYQMKQFRRRTMVLIDDIMDERPQREFEPTISSGTLNITPSLNQANEYETIERMPPVSDVNEQNVQSEHSQWWKVESLN